nr:hypothetical protein [Bradyrhizobium sp. 170]
MDAARRGKWIGFLCLGVTTSTGMLLVPLIGVISAALILGEPLGMREVVAMVLTLGGVTLALQKA